MNSWNSWNSWNSFRWNLLFVERFFVLQQACCLDSATFRAFRHNGLGVITLDVNVNCLLCPLLGRSFSFEKHKYPPTASTDPVCRPFQYFHYHQMNAGKKTKRLKSRLQKKHLTLSIFEFLCLQISEEMSSIICLWRARSTLLTARYDRGAEAKVYWDQIIAYWRLW